jgi:hypothetical protein
MSWSDHKDDKSRFDGWREFLNEGKEQQPEQVIKEELEKITEGFGPYEPGEDWPKSPEKQRMIQEIVVGLLKGDPESGVTARTPEELVRMGSGYATLRSIETDAYGLSGGRADGRVLAAWVADAIAGGKVSLPENPEPAALSEGAEEAMDPRALRDLISHILDPSTDMNDVQQALKSTVLSAVMEVAKSVYRDPTDGPRRAMIRGIIEEVADPDLDNLAEVGQYGLDLPGGSTRSVADPHTAALEALADYLRASYGEDQNLLDLLQDAEEAIVDFERSVEAEEVY